MRRSVAMAVLVALGVGACGDSAITTTTVQPTVAATTVPPTVASTVSTLPQAIAGLKPYGGTATAGYLFDEEPSTLNPYLFPGGLADFNSAVFVSLVEFNPLTGSPFSRVAEEVPTLGNGGVVLNDDGTMAVRYRLRDDAVWADGIPISGDDLAFTYATITDPDLPILEFSGLAHADILPESVQAGPKTFQFTLRAPTVRYVEMFPFILPKHEVEGSDFVNDWNDRLWVSAGPFVVEEWKKGESLRFVRNDRYWLTDPDTGQAIPYLDGFELRYLGEQELIEAIRSRQVTGAVLPPVPSVIEEVAAFPGITMTVVPGGAWEHLAFQFGPRRLERNSGSLNEHVLFRRAVAHAIDKKRLVAEAFGEFSDPSDSYVELFSPTLSRSPWSRYDYDPDRARELLAELCTQLGRDCAVEVPRVVFSSTDADHRQRIGAALQEMLDEVGIEVELQLEDADIFLGPTLGLGTFDLGEWAWGFEPALPGMIAFHNSFDPDQTPTLADPFANTYRWGSAAVDIADDPATADFDEAALLNQGPSSVIDSHTARFAELYDQMRSTVDLEALTQIVLEAEEILADQVVIIPLAQRPFVVPEWRDQLETGFVNRRGAPPSPELWYRTDL